MTRLSKSQYQMQVGAFVFAGVALMVLVLFMLGSERRRFDDYFEISAFFQNVSGLRPGTPIQLAGVPVGQVQSINFPENPEDTRIKVVLSISENFRSRIRQDSTVSIVTQGLLGDNMLLIQVGSAASKMIEPGATLASQEALALEHILRKGEKVVDSVHTVVQQTQDILQQLKQGPGLAHELVYGEKGVRLVRSLDQSAKHLELTMEKIESITSKIDGGQGTLGGLVNDMTLYNDMRTLMGKANRNQLVQALVQYTLRTKEGQNIRDAKDVAPSSR